jgi:hypothetical protein
MSDSKIPRSFSRDEVEEILRRAADHAKAATDDGIRHEELLQAAREAGLDPDAIDAAAGELEAQRADKRAYADAELQIKEERRRGFLQSLLTYLVVGGFLTAINLTVASGVWIVWVLAMWGLFVALRGSRLLLSPAPEKVEKRVLKQKKRRADEDRKNQRRRAAEAWAERLRNPPWAENQKSAAPGNQKSREGKADDAARVSRNFEDAVDSGVQALLGIVARRIREVAAAAEASERRRQDTDFNRYVARKQRTAGDEVPPPARVRVEVGPARAPASPSSTESTEGEVEDEARRERERARRRERR